MAANITGQPPFTFTHRDDLHVLPASTLAHEAELHGGFAVDKRPGRGEVYYGMPGIGLLRASADLTRQDVIALPPELTPVNFHSTKIGTFDGKTRLFLAAEGKEMVAVVTLDGEIDSILPRPEFDEYKQPDAAYRPTDTALVGDQLYVADGYGSNYINAVNLASRQWARIFGGDGAGPSDHHGFGTAHGLGRSPTHDHHHLVIADRPNSRFEVYSSDGKYAATFGLPAGSRPCGVDYLERDGRWYAAVGSLDDPQPGRPAPIYILDASSYQVLSTIRAKDDLGIVRADHIHNVVWHSHAGRLFLVCQSWNPGFFFVLEHVI